MAGCDCCGCLIVSDYGTSLVTGTGAADDPYRISIVEPTWARPSARIRRATSQSVASGAAFVPVSFDTEVFDQGNFWSVASPTLFTMPENGIYIFGACAQWANNATGTRELGFRLNGTTILQINDQLVDPTNGGTTQPWSHVTYQRPLGAGETLELIARQESGGALNLLAAANESIVFWIVYAGRTM